MTYHVLTGDALLHNFPKGKLAGSVIIIRECLIEGPVLANSPSEFWQLRETYLTETYPNSDINYAYDVIFEFEKLNELKDGDEVNFWFEHDLFCQINLWFTISLLPEKFITINRVSPMGMAPEFLWYGFGPMSSNDLIYCFSKRTTLTQDDVVLGRSLWKAYSTSNWPAFSNLSSTNSRCFPHLEQVCKAQLDRVPLDAQLGRPEKILKEIIESGTQSFEEAFSIFSEKEGIYGFGDSQVRRIYEQLIK